MLQMGRFLGELAKNAPALKNCSILAVHVEKKKSACYVYIHKKHECVVNNYRTLPSVSIPNRKALDDGLGTRVSFSAEGSLVTIGHFYTNKIVHKSLQRPRKAFVFPLGAQMQLKA